MLELSNDNKSRFHLIQTVSKEHACTSNDHAPKSILDAFVNQDEVLLRNNVLSQGVFINNSFSTIPLPQDEVAFYTRLTHDIFNQNGKELQALVNIPPLPTMKMPLCKGSSHIPFFISETAEVTRCALHALKQKNESIGIIQFGAHANLQQSSKSNFYSRESLMRRTLEEVPLPLFQVGVRSLCAKEQEYRKEANIITLDASTLRCPKPWGNISRSKGVGRPIPPLLPFHFPGLVYITFSADTFDASLFPATSRPELGGLFWWDVMHLIERCLAGRVLVGFDVVDFTPVSTIPAYAHIIGKLLYEVMGMIAPSGE